MLGAHLFVREGSSDPMTDTNPSYGGVRATGTLALADDVPAGPAGRPGLARATPSGGKHLHGLGISLCASGKIAAAS